MSEAPRHLRRRVIMDEEAALITVLGLGIIVGGPLGVLAIRMLALGAGS